MRRAARFPRRSPHSRSATGCRPATMRAWHPRSRRARPPTSPDQTRRWPRRLGIERTAVRFPNLSPPILADDFDHGPRDQRQHSLLFLGTGFAAGDREIRTFQAVGELEGNVERVNVAASVRGTRPDRLGDLFHRLWMLVGRPCFPDRQGIHHFQANAESVGAQQSRVHQSFRASAPAAGGIAGLTSASRNRPAPADASR